MSVTDAELKGKLSAMGHQADNWRKLCDCLSLSHGASLDAVLLSAEQRGYAAAVTDYSILASDLARKAKRRNGEVH